jgi:hypothetical protein
MDEGLGRDDLRRQRTAGTEKPFPRADTEHSRDGTNSGYILTIDSIITIKNLPFGRSRGITVFS